MKAFWLILGLSALVLAIAGIVLPLVPTVPLLLLATYAFARSSPRLHHWLLAHPRLGPPITAWNQRGVISLRAKRAATVSIAMVFLISLALGLGWWILAIQAMVLMAVLTFIWACPAE